MTLFWMLAVLAAIAVAYAFVLRPRLKVCPWFVPFYAWIEPIESWAWDKSRTLLVSRLYLVAGVLLAVHDGLLPILGAVDITPFIPEQYQKFYPMALALTGVLFEWLRRVTKEPLADKE
jgi:hypothetical protein